MTDLTEMQETCRDLAKAVDYRLDAATLDALVGMVWEHAQLVQQRENVAAFDRLLDQTDEPAFA